MGTKASKPVAKYEIVEATVGRRIGQFQRSFMQLTGRSDLRGSIKRRQFDQLVDPALAEFGDAVRQRLFEVCAAQQPAAMTYENFAIALYIFSYATVEEKLRLVFNMFDISSSGFVNKRELGQLGKVLIERGCKQQTTLAVDTEFGQERRTVTLEDMKPLYDAMGEAIVAEYDTDGDGKLSFDEWMPYAERSLDVENLLHALAKVLPEDGV